MMPTSLSNASPGVLLACPIDTFGLPVFIMHANVGFIGIFFAVCQIKMIPLNTAVQNYPCPYPGPHLSPRGRNLDLVKIGTDGL